MAPQVAPGAEVEAGPPDTKLSRLFYLQLYSEAGYERAKVQKGLSGGLGRLRGLCEALMELGQSLSRFISHAEAVKSIGEEEECLTMI